MADDFPPLPQGFNPADANSAAPPASDPAFPALPQGFKAPPAETMDTGRTDYTVNDPEGGSIKPEHMAELEAELNRINSDKNLSYGGRLEQARAASEKYGQHLQESDIRNAMKTPGRAIRLAPITNEDFRQNAGQHDYEVALARRMQQIGIDPTDPSIAATLKRTAFGMVQSGRNVAENLAALGLDAMGKIGIINPDDAYNGAHNVRSDMRFENDMADSSDAGKAGRIGGDLLLASRLPVAGRAAEGAEALTTMQRLAGLARRVGTNAGSGAAASLVTPSESSEQAMFQMGVGAVANPALVPTMEWLIGHGGQAATTGYMNVLGKGVGRDIYQDGQLTQFGRMLKTRLQGLHPDMPETMIDDSLKGIVTHNPKQLPEDAHIVNEGLARHENVPLTAGEKMQDPQRMQVYERAKVGSVGGPEIQREALAAENASSDALLGNVERIGSGADTTQAATDAGEAIHARATAAQDAVDAKYETLRQSSEPVTRVGQAALKASLHEAYDAAGQAGVDTLSPEAKNLARQLNSLAESKKPPRFGQVWALSRTINAKARAAFGTSEGVDISRIQSAMNNWLEGANGEYFARGDKGVASSLSSANSDYKALNDQFGSRAANVRGGGKLSDAAGKSIATIVAAVKQASSDGPRAGTDISDTVERQIFGSGKGFSVQAANTVKQIAKVSPEAIPHIRDVFINRLAREITESTAGNGKAIKAGTMQKAINDIIGRNREGLLAIGITPSQVQSLENNAYLASLKVLPPGARNVGSGKFLNALVWSLRHSLGRVAGFALGAGEAAHMGGGGAVPVIAGAIGSEAAQGVGRVIEEGVARRAISGKVPVRENAGGRVGKAVGRKAGTAATIGLTDLVGGN